MASTPGCSSGSAARRHPGARYRMDLQPPANRCGDRRATRRCGRPSRPKSGSTRRSWSLTKEVVEPAGKALGGGAVVGSRRRPGAGASGPDKAAVGSRDRDKPTPLAVNDPLAFISFIAEHRRENKFEGEVEGYTSHGAVVRVGDEMRCYIPLANLGGTQAAP